jgi:hypothetical protein
MVPGNAPQPYELTNKHPPKEVRARLKEEIEPTRALRLWDSTYTKRANACGVFLACEADFLELTDPPVIRRSDFERIFGRLPGMQNPPAIKDQEYADLQLFAARRDVDSEV